VNPWLPVASKVATPERAVDDAQKFLGVAMPSVSIALLQHDPKVSQSLANLLSRKFSSVHAAGSVSELERQIRKHRAKAAILDLEVASLSDVQALSREFPGTHIVCNHRIADDKMWTDVLDAGAADCLPSSDAEGIVSAAVRESYAAESIAA
jgi:DNA-binding NarL/FixJ family response regulator